MRDVIIVGADIEIIELTLSIGEFSIYGIIDKHLSGNYYGFDILGNDDFLIEQKDKYLSMELVVTLDDVHVKEELYKKYKNHGFSFVKLISPRATVSQYADINEGVIIQNCVNIGPNTFIGKLSKINVKANIMHDVLVGNFCTIAPNSVVLGYVKLGSNVFLGSNSTVLPRCEIENNVYVGAGAIVTKRLHSGLTYVGIPAREYNKR
jgi:sugar O-acyltransferase (sialic acid O-acetyltransferase NeuD family)